MTDSVLIIGGGIIGLSIARELHRSGVTRITVVDKGGCGEEASWAAGGMLGPQAEADGIDDLTKFCLLSRDLYPQFAAELFNETGVDVELDRSGTLYLAFTEADADKIRRRYEAQRNAGLIVEHLSAVETRRAEPFVSPDVLASLYFSGDWQVENRKLLSALRRYAEMNGIELIEGSEVERLIVEDNAVIGCETVGGRILAGHTVLAAGAWSSLIDIGIATMPFSVEPVRGEIIMFKTAKRLIERVIYSHRGYLVPRVDGRILAGATSENVGFDRSTSENAAISLKAMAAEIASRMDTLPIADHWSGLRPRAVDSLPVLGPIAGLDGLTIATAHFRNGILLAPVTARIISASIIEGARSPYLDIFGPERFTLKRARTQR